MDCVWKPKRVFQEGMCKSARREWPYAREIIHRSGVLADAVGISKTAWHPRGMAPRVVQIDVRSAQMRRIGPCLEKGYTKPMVGGNGACGLQAGTVNAILDC